MNQAFIREVHTRSRPLNVDSMDAAALVLAREIAKGPLTDIDPETWARHLAWVLGFDALIDDRKALHHLTTHMVQL